MKKFDKYIEQETRHAYDLKKEINNRLSRMSLELLQVLWYIDRRMD